VGGDGHGAFFFLGGGGAGGPADANSTATSRGSGASSSATATGDTGGDFNADGPNELGGGGAGGAADANSTAASSGAGNVTSSATATGGAGGELFGGVPGFTDGAGGDATATANALSAGGGTAIAKAVATGGVGGSPLVASGAANATSNAETAKGALAQAQSTAVGSSGTAQSTALTSYSFVKVQSVAVAPTGSTATTNAIAQGGGSGQAFANPGQTAYAFSTALPDKAYSATLIDGASNVAGALLGPRDMVFGTAILGANYAADGGGESHTYSGSSTFDFGYGGDLMLGLIDDQHAGFSGGLGFQSLEFTILDNGVEISI
jgi:hypothetical protein